MAKKKQEQQIEEKNVESTVEDNKIRIKKPSFKKNTDEVKKVDLREFNKTKEEVITKEEENQQTKDAVQESKTEELPVGDKSTTSETVGEENTQSEDRQENKEQVSENEQESVLEEITEEEVQEKTEDLTEEVKEAVEEQKQTGVDLPENIQKVVDFI